MSCYSNNAVENRNYWLGSQMTIAKQQIVLIVLRAVSHIDIVKTVLNSFRPSFRIRSKRQAEDHEESLHNYFDHPPEICALGRDTNGSAFAVFFQEVSEFEACVELGCIPPSTFRVEHTSREVCEDAIDGVPTCVTSTNFWGITTVSHCTLPIHWDDPFPVRQTFADLEYCGIQTIPILHLFAEIRFYPFQRDGDCGYLALDMPTSFPTPEGYQSPFDFEVGFCKFTFYTNYTYKTEWCAFPTTMFLSGYPLQCNPGPITDDIRLQDYMRFLSKNECESVKLLEVAYQYRLEEDVDIPWRWIFMMTSWNGNIFHVTGPLCGEFTGHRWIPLTNASDAELWCLLLSEPE